MDIDGRKIAQGIKGELAREVGFFEVAPVLGVVQVGEDPVVSRYVGVKKRLGEEVGVEVVHVRLPVEATTEEVIEAIEELAGARGGEPLNETVFPSGGHRGVIVQLPLPSHLDTDAILDSIPLEADVDMLSTSARENFEDGTSSISPPVIAAIAEVCSLHNLELAGRRAAVIGYGRLVGQPVAVWLRHEGALVDVFTKGDSLTEVLSEYDMIISGVGVPGIITPEMVRDGVVLIDVGTSEEGGELKGDINPACATKAALYTPVPGGIGPLTVAMLFQNLCTLAENS